jgi:hypothetical protein
VLRLSERWREFLLSQPETGMGYQIVSVVLRNGRRYDCVVVVDGCIAEIRGDQEIPFGVGDIEEMIVTHDWWRSRKRK